MPKKKKNCLCKIPNLLVVVLLLVIAVLALYKKEVTKTATQIFDTKEYATLDEKQKICKDFEEIGILDYSECLNQKWEKIPNSVEGVSDQYETEI